MPNGSVLETHDIVSKGGVLETHDAVSKGSVLDTPPPRETHDPLTKRSVCFSHPRRCDKRECSSDACRCAKGSAFQTHGRNSDGSQPIGITELG